MNLSPYQGAGRPLQHGGEIAAAEACFGRPAEGWLDLSTGINPVPYPATEVAEGLWRRLPESGLIARLEDAARAHYGVCAEGCVVAAPGTQALIQWLPRIRPASSVVVIAPTYGEHSHAWWQAGHAVIEATDLAAVPPAADVVVCTNPNNPDGRRFDPERLLDLAGGLAMVGGALVVDEAFCDGAPELSLAANVGRPGLVVLRSFGKFFGLAGVRLGFALTEADTAAALRGALGPWPVSGPAAEIGARALSDRPWIEATRTRLKADSARLRGLLTETGLEVVGATDLFVLVATGAAAALAEHLGRRGILVRPFDAEPGWLRFGLPAAKPDWQRLATALSAWGAGE